MKMTNVEIREDEKLVIVSMEGKMISGEQNKVYLQFVEEHLEKGMVNFLLDCSGLEFINSSAIGAIIQSLIKINGCEGKMSIYSCQKSVLEIFTITRMQKKLGLCKTKEEALKYINS